jgi:hypothetical protein
VALVAKRTDNAKLGVAMERPAYFRSVLAGAAAITLVLGLLIAPGVPGFARRRLRSLRPVLSP